jgi:hypothetical protein
MMKALKRKLVDKMGRLRNVAMSPPVELLYIGVEGKVFFYNR